MKRVFCFVVYIVSLLLPLSAEENYKSKYLELLSKSKYDSLLDLLKEWESVNKNDVELHIAYFNYYTNKGVVSENIMGQMPDGRYGMYSRIGFKEPEKTLAEQSLNKALSINPDRIDVYLGKMEFFQKQERFEKLKVTILDMLKRIDVNKNDWIWKDNQKLIKAGKNPEDVIVNAINFCLGQIINNPKYLDLGYEISKEEYKYFPRNIFVQNVYGSYLIEKKMFNEGISIFIAANKQQPKDFIIITNLARAYEMNNNNEEAIKYYTMLLDSGNDELIEYGRSSISRVKENKK